MIERIEHHDVEGIRVGRFGSQINTTCIVYRLGSTVIDVGPPNQWRTVRRFLAERPVSRVVVTHHHEDHAGNLARVGRAHEAEVLSPAGGLAPLAEGFALKPYQHLIWGRPRRVRPQPIAGEIDLGGGRTLLPVAAPGHSADMTCFYDRERGWLFTGDLYISSKTRYLRADEDLGAELASLRRILELDFDTLFCSHRGVVENGKAALAAKLRFLEDLGERVRLLREEGRSVAEISRALLGREDLTSFLTGFHFSKRNLIAACAAIFQETSEDASET